MIRSLTEEQKTELIEELADIVHCHWGDGLRHFLEFYNRSNRRWWEQKSHMAYKNLPEVEKEEDRVWARKVLQLFEDQRMEVVSK